MIRREAGMENILCITGWEWGLVWGTQGVTLKNKAVMSTDHEPVWD